MKRKFEFSKFIMVALLFTYYLGLWYIMTVVNKLIVFIFDSTDLGFPTVFSSISSISVALMTFIGTPVTVACKYYSQKAGSENIEKIKGECMKDGNN